MTKRLSEVERAELKRRRDELRTELKWIEVELTADATFRLREQLSVPFSAAFFNSALAR